MRNAKGLEGAETQHTRDLDSAQAALAAAFNNAATQFNETTGASQKMIASINAYSDGLNDLSYFMKNGEWPEKTKKDLEDHLNSPAYEDPVKQILREDYEKKRAIAGLPPWTRTPPVNQSSGWGDVPLPGVTPSGPRWGMLPHTMPKPTASPGITPTMTYRTGVEGSGGAQSVSVNGSVTGEVSVKNEVTTSSTLLSIVDGCEGCGRSRQRFYFKRQRPRQQR
ncbi:hypothetical protein [Bradyrhizobium sp. USDA 10063]